MKKQELQGQLENRPSAAYVGTFLQQGDMKPASRSTRKMSDETLLYSRRQIRQSDLQYKICNVSFILCVNFA